MNSEDQSLLATGRFPPAFPSLRTVAFMAKNIRAGLIPVYSYRASRGIPPAGGHPISFEIRSCHHITPGIFLSSKFITGAPALTGYIVRVSGSRRG